MSEPVLPMSLDPAGASPEARARAVAAILAAGLLRLCTPIILPSDTAENSSESTPNCLAESAEKSVTVSAG
jgi:hypothetical protein